MKNWFCLWKDDEGMEERLYDDFHDAWDMARSCEANPDCMYWWGMTQGARGDAA